MHRTINHAVYRQRTAVQMWGCGSQGAKASSIIKGFFFLRQVIKALTALVKDDTDIIVLYRSAGAAWLSKETSELQLLLAGLRRPVMVQHPLTLALVHALRGFCEAGSPPCKLPRR